jgi:hypothetical protein
MPNTFYPFTNSSISWTYEIVFISLGGGRIRYIWSDSRNTAPNTQQIFKIVTVSGTAKAAHPNTDWNNYEEVEKLIAE